MLAQDPTSSIKHIKHVKKELICFILGLNLGDFNMGTNGRSVGVDSVERALASETGTGSERLGVREAAI